MTIEKQKQLFRPVTTGANSTRSQSEFLAISCNSPKAREKSCTQEETIYLVLSHWLKNWREIFKPMTKYGNRNRAAPLEIYLKTVQFRLMQQF